MNQFDGPASNGESDRLALSLAGLKIPPPRPLLEQIATQFARIPGPIEPCYVAFSARGVRAIVPASAVNDDPAAFVALFEERFLRPLRPSESPPPGLRGGIAARSAASVIFDFEGLGGFAQTVLQKALEIPPGQVRPYGWIAREIGKPRAVRAVGTALARNPIPLLIPCHRVVRNDGSAGNYAFGTAMKLELLANEGLDIDELQSLTSRRVRFVGSATTRIACYPSCEAARAIDKGQRREFQSGTEVVSSGYRACRHCRPIFERLD